MVAARTSSVKVGEVDRTVQKKTYSSLFLDKENVLISPSSSPSTISTHSDEDEHHNNINSSINIDTVSDDFGVLKLIDDDPEEVKSFSTSPSRSSAHCTTDDESPVSDWSIPPIPLGGASGQFETSFPIEGEIENGRAKKGRRWTVNIPSLSQFGSGTSTDLFLSPFDETESADGSVATYGDIFAQDHPHTHTDFGELCRKQQLEDMHAEEQRLKEQLDQIRQKKNLVQSAQLGVSPPSSPTAFLGLPPSSPALRENISARRHSYFDATPTWGSSSLNYTSLKTDSPEFVPQNKGKLSGRGEPMRRHSTIPSAYALNTYNQFAHYMDANAQQQNETISDMGTYSGSYYPHQFYYAQMAQHMMNGDMQGMLQHRPVAPQAPMPKQQTGPPGANLFVFNFPRVFSNADLEQAFKPFGNVLSAMVFIDKVTQRSKCFGFVSYDSAESAELAIAEMNGAQLGGKTIKVQHKRESQGNNNNNNNSPSPNQEDLRAPSVDTAVSA